MAAPLFLVIFSFFYSSRLCASQFVRLFGTCVYVFFPVILRKTANDSHFPNYASETVVNDLKLKIRVGAVQTGSVQRRWGQVGPLRCASEDFAVVSHGHRGHSLIIQRAAATAGTFVESGAVNIPVVTARRR